MENRKIMVIGDLMLDKYTFGKVERVNPEAPSPLLSVEREECVLGGAGNVVNNLIGLKSVCSFSGLANNNDIYGKLLSEIFKEQNINFLLVNDKRPTTVKHRFVADPYKQQVLRVDYEDKKLISELYVDKILKFVKTEDPAILIISDYAKGVITKYLIDKLKKGFKGKIIVDPKPKNINLFRDTYLITPNKKEASEFLEHKINESNCEYSAKELSKKLNTNVIITLGEEGSILYNKEQDNFFRLHSKPKKLHDVSGAGDTYIATIAYALSNNYTLEKAVKLANKAAEIVVGKMGTSPIQYDELFDNEKQN